MFSNEIRLGKSWRLKEFEQKNVTLTADDCTTRADFRMSRTGLQVGYFKAQTRARRVNTTFNSSI